jgi:cytochrome c556
MAELSNRVIAAALSIAVAPALAAQDAVEKAVEYRHGLMEVFAYNAGSMGDMVKGKTQFQVASFARHAKDLSAAAGLDLLAGFPADSVSEESDASSTIWLDWNRFQEKYKALQLESAKLAEVAAGGDEAAMKEQFGKTARTCKGCHDDFKN